jgi:hypothetical protein
MITEAATPASPTPTRRQTRPEPQVRRPLIGYAMALTTKPRNKQQNG